jgi:serine phosphatase RsbU (regulator of sigma subunit)
MPDQVSIPYTLIDDRLRTSGVITRFPFTCGRLPTSDLVLSRPYVSRRHAQILFENGAYTLVDLGSRHGTYLNGQLIQDRVPLRQGDILSFGTLSGPVLHFGISAVSSTSTIRDFVHQMPEIATGNTSIEKLRWFFDAARKLTGEGGMEQILAALLETTLELTQVERGFVFLCSPAGELQLAMARSREGAAITDDASVSHGAIREALKTSREFIVTDTLSADQRSESVVAHSIRSVICIPLRRHRGAGSDRESQNLGLLYLDSRLRAGALSDVDSNLLRAIATDAAALIDNAQLALAEESERRYREELNVAAKIQSNIMTAKLPSVPFATVAARSIPCREIGGDFFLAIAEEDILTVAVADVSGKGISAAILACTMQGMMYAQLLSRQPLDAMAAAVNRYICEKDIGKYATMAVVRIYSDGRCEYINCGHVPPFVCSNNTAIRLPESNLPVGMIERAEFTIGETKLEPASRLVIVTDGVTEARNSNSSFFGEERVSASIARCESLEDIFQQVQDFCQAAEADDDCTVLEVLYSG